MRLVGSGIRTRERFDRSKSIGFIDSKRFFILFFEEILLRKGFFYVYMEISGAKRRERRREHTCVREHTVGPVTEFEFGYFDWTVTTWGPLFLAQ